MGLRLEGGGGNRRLSICGRARFPVDSLQFLSFLSLISIFLQSAIEDWLIKNGDGEETSSTKE